MVGWALHIRYPLKEFGYDKFGLYRDDGLFFF